MLISKKLLDTRGPHISTTPAKGLPRKRKEGLTQTGLAGDAEENVADVALLVLGDEDAVDRFSEWLRQAGFAHG
jgi:hypothetical protein